VTTFGEKTTVAIEKLFNAVRQHPERKRKDFSTVISDPMEEKDDRTKAHTTIRRVFSSQLETSTGKDNCISISRGIQSVKEGRRTNEGRGRGRPGWGELGGEYLHFTLYKENKDTMEVINYLCTQMKTKSRNFQFAGTKDRRAVSVQRVSTYRTQSDRLAAIGRTLRGSKIGDFKYEKYPLVLGQLQGNEFVITLRDSHFPGEEGLAHEERLALAKSVVDEAGNNFRSKGFINYYGLQRFGSFSTSTDEIGRSLLQGDLKGAIDLILSYSPTALIAAQSGEESTTIPSDDRNRALAIYTWETTQDSKRAIELLPRKFSAESCLIRYLGQTKDGKRIKETDYQGAFSNIPRNLRLMYVHAYQSLVWNTVAARRWEKFGDQVVEGDLVIINKQKSHEDSTFKQESVDESGEVIVSVSQEETPAGEDIFTRARPLTKAEAESGEHTVWDIVLPLPGFDVEYPTNEIGEFYNEFMGSSHGGGLDPQNMRRKWKDISLSGGYRKLLARPTEVSWEVKSYVRDTEQLVETDMDRIIKTKSQPNEDQQMEQINPEASDKKIAVVLSMQLGSSQYATMALREMLKGGLTAYVAEFNKER
jgi:tRNA pseudouridine13 synthase